MWNGRAGPGGFIKNFPTFFCTFSSAGPDPVLDTGCYKSLNVGSKTNHSIIRTVLCNGVQKWNFKSSIIAPAVFPLHSKRLRLDSFPDTWHFGTDPDPDPWIRHLIWLRILLFSSHSTQKVMGRRRLRQKRIIPKGTVPGTSTDLIYYLWQNINLGGLSHSPFSARFHD